MLFFHATAYLELPLAAITSGTGELSTVSFQHGVIKNMDGGIVSKVGANSIDNVDYSRFNSQYKQVIYEKTSFYGIYTPSNVYLETFNTTHRCMYVDRSLDPECIDDTLAVSFGVSKHKNDTSATRRLSVTSAFIGRSVNGSYLNGNFASLNVFSTALSSADISLLTIPPTNHPTGRPSGQPSGEPSTQPSRQPTSQPTTFPSTQPSRQPTSQPTTFNFKNKSIKIGNVTTKVWFQAILGLVIFFGLAMCCLGVVRRYSAKKLIKGDAETQSFDNDINYSKEEEEEEEEEEEVVVVEEEKEDDMFTSTGESFKPLKFLRMFCLRFEYNYRVARSYLVKKLVKDDVEAQSVDNDSNYSKEEEEEEEEEEKEVVEKESIYIQ
jgi:hypothetical protein